MQDVDRKILRHTNGSLQIVLSLLQRAEERYTKTVTLTPSDGIPLLSLGRMLAISALKNKAKNGSEKVIKKVRIFNFMNQTCPSREFKIQVVQLVPVVRVVK